MTGKPFIHSPHFYWWGNWGQSVQLARRPYSRISLTHHMFHTPGCRKSFTELVENVSPQLFLFSMRVYVLQILSLHSAFFSESKEMQTLCFWHKRTWMKGYLITRNWGDVVEVTTKGSPWSVCQKPGWMSFKESSPRLCLNMLVCLFPSHFLTSHCHLLASRALCDPHFFLLKPQSLFAETSAWAEQPQTTFKHSFHQYFLQGNERKYYAS